MRFFSFVFSAVFLFQVSSAKELRKVYPNLPTIETEELKADFSNYFIVDVRSKSEFDVIHMKGATHLPVSNLSFEKKLKQLEREKKKIVFYCNGVTCAKSFKAGKRAKKLGVTDFVVYDSGIFEWVTANPGLGVLLGESPVVSSKILNKAKLKKHMKSWADFLKTKKESPKTAFIDIREPFQKKNSSVEKVVQQLEPTKVPFDNFVKLLNLGRYKDKTLYILDATGRQVRWLQYHLENSKTPISYFFLEGGAKDLEGERGLASE